MNTAVSASYTLRLKRMEYFGVTNDDWTAVSAIGTAAAASIALLIWVCALVKECGQQQKRIRVHRALLAHELAKVSKHAKSLYSNTDDLGARLACSKQVEQIKSALYAPSATELLKLTDGLPEQFAVVISDFAALVQTLRIEIGLEHQSLEILKAQSNTTPATLSKETLNRLRELAEETVRHCRKVAIAIEHHGELPKGSVVGDLKIEAAQPNLHATVTPKG